MSCLFSFKVGKTVHRCEVRPRVAIFDLAHTLSAKAEKVGKIGLREETFLAHGSEAFCNFGLGFWRRWGAEETP